MKAIFTPIILSLCILAGCSTLTLKPCDFAWPVETVLPVDGHGNVRSDRYSFSLNIKGLLFAETQDSVNISKSVVRIIRDGNGYFFVTAPKFKNVYVFEQVEGGMALVKKIFVAENGMSDPAMNQRAPYIQLQNGQNPAVLMTKDGVTEGDKK